MSRKWRGNPAFSRDLGLPAHLISPETRTAQRFRFSSTFGGEEATRTWRTAPCGLSSRVSAFCTPGCVCRAQTFKRSFSSRRENRESPFLCRFPCRRRWVFVPPFSRTLEGRLTPRTPLSRDSVEQRWQREGSSLRNLVRLASVPGSLALHAAVRTKILSAAVRKVCFS